MALADCEELKSRVIGRVVLNSKVIKQVLYYPRTSNTIIAYVIYLCHLVSRACGCRAYGCAKT